MTLTKQKQQRKVKVKSSKNFSYTAKKILANKELYLLLLPGVIWYLLFAYRPLMELRLAFYDYNVFQGIEGSTFVGFQNFIEFFSGKDFLRVLKNTLALAFWQLVICFPFPIILAICITEMRNKFISRMTQLSTLLTHFISVVVVCGMVVNFLSPSTGVINFVIEKLGFEPIYFMTKPEYFRGIYTLMNLWRNAGFNALVYIAAIMGISPELYEAATVDGAGKFKKILHVTIPAIIPTIVTMLILQLGGIIKVGYEAIMLLYQPVTYSTADVISTYSYRMAFESGNYGLSVAAGLFESVVAFVMIIIANKVSKKISDSALW